MKAKQIRNIAVKVSKENSSLSDIVKRPWEK